MSTSSPLILVVDDLAANRDTLLVLLEPENYRLLEAPDGPTALRLAAESPPDLVLLDVMMPGMDGYEVCRHLRANARLAEVPIIMITALDDQAARIAGIEAGADDFITKPFHRHELRARIRTITRLNRYRRLIEMEEQMRHAQRLENLGMLAAGIAHDFNNALAPIVMSGPLLRQHISDPGALRILGTVEKSVERGVGLVRQLLSFTRGSSGTRQLLQARHVLREVIDLVETTFPKSIRVESHMPADLWPVQCNPTQLHQVLLNLCVNARDAMPQGGELIVKAANRPLDAAAITEFTDARPGAFLSVEVRDSGTGIPPEVLARIWDPFFTTKGVGKGTGLGLSTVRGIVQQHDGFLTVKTQPGAGTAFTVYLPAAEHEIGDGEASARHVQPELGRGELILVVDDDALVRLTIEQILHRSGYRTITASDGAEAIALFAPQAEEVQLLLTDLQMPMVDGATLVTALRRINPCLPVVAMSGAENGGRATTMAFANGLLAKPFRAETLLSLVRRTLDDASPAGGAPAKQ